MKISRKLMPFAVAAALAVPASGAIAGGFGIGTQSGSGTGNAFAGGAAAADDSSVAWYNPAAMFALAPGKQITVAGHALKPSFKFTNSGASTGAFLGAGTGEGNDGGDWNFVPNAFYTMDINPNWRFGFAVNAPFGLKTDYDAGWRGRFQALKSDIKSVNLNPSIAYKVSDRLSIGAGVSVQKIDATLTSDATAAALGLVTLKADDVGYGFNLGMSFQATPDTRIGAHYRSTVKYDLEGTATFSAVAALNGGIRADLKVPDSFSVSVFHKLNPKWELMGDITWTGWSSVQQLAVIRTTGAVGTLLPGSPLLFRWDDTWRVGVGANYKVNDNMKLRFGVAFDQTPTNDVDRTPKLPDQDRTWIAIGVQHRLSKAGVLEAGYAHEFVKDASINNVTAVGTLRGSFKNKADIFSLQYSHSF